MKDILINIEYHYFSSIYIANNGSCLREKKEKSKIIIVAATCFIISILLIGPNGEQKQKHSKKIKLLKHKVVRRTM